jgi:hypothetical protein
MRRGSMGEIAGAFRRAAVSGDAINRPCIRDPDGFIIEVGQSNPGVAYG